MNLEEFQCRLCGSIEQPKKKDTYWYCQECGVIFTDPGLFTEVIEENNEQEEILEEEENQEEFEGIFEKSKKFKRLNYA